MVGKLYTFVAMAILALVGAAPVLAVSVSGGSDTLQIKDLPEGTIEVRITGPDGFATTTSDGRLGPGAKLPDGQYRFEVKAKLAAPKQAASRYKQGLNNGRSGPGKRGPAVGVIEHGQFRISDGTAVTDTALKE